MGHGRRSTGHIGRFFGLIAEINHNFLRPFIFGHISFRPSDFRLTVIQSSFNYYTEAYSEQFLLCIYQKITIFYTNMFLRVLI